ncbi:MAG: DUF72 domain-containing protein [Armatimonadetes bacterium]|nr:DUF72 domain-containing protein [Armatimonadota bacterium]MDW8121743.1 DUF72 domain-containing protein [Armatimonadota bacterium]
MGGCQGKGVDFPTCFFFDLSAAHFRRPMGILRIGTAGYKYDDWVGKVYPPTLAARDYLSFYATKFDCVEINASFYTLLSPYTYRQMARKTPTDFEFVVKAHKGLTHEIQDARETARAFKDSVQPLTDAGKLGCCLLQFPQRCHRSPENLEYLERLVDWLAPLPLVVEFRHRSWVNDEVFDTLRQWKVGFVSVDEPKLPGLMPPVIVPTPISYVRFHGRNADKWYQHDHPYERYDYLYSEEELMEWLPKIRQLVSESEKCYVIFNNHYEGKSAINAEMLKELCYRLWSPEE